MEDKVLLHKIRCKHKYLFQTFIFFLEAFLILPKKNFFPNIKLVKITKVNSANEVRGPDMKDNSSIVSVKLNSTRCTRYGRQQSSVVSGCVLSYLVHLNEHVSGQLIVKSCDRQTFKS